MINETRPVRHFVKNTTTTTFYSHIFHPVTTATTAETTTESYDITVRYPIASTLSQIIIDSIPSTEESFIYEEGDYS